MYSIDHDPAFEGQVGSGARVNRKSAFNASGKNIPFGAGVFYPADSTKALVGKLRTADLPAEDADIKNFAGIALREVVHAFADGEEFGAKRGFAFTVVDDGDVYIKPVSDVVADTDVYVRVAGDDAGKFCSEAGEGETLSLKVPGAVWTATASAGQMVTVQLNRGRF